MFKQVKVADIEKTATVVVCDSCEAPAIEYYELEGPILNSRRTGRVSPINIFGSAEEHPTGLRKCYQCKGTFCSNCITRIASVWEEVDEEHIGDVFLCNECNKNRSGYVQTIIDNVEESFRLHLKACKLCENAAELYKKSR